MTREDIEQLSAFVVNVRDGAQTIVDACNLFLKYLESTALGVPQDPAVWDTLDWEQREKEETKFKYEMIRIDEENELHRQLRILIKHKKGTVKMGAYSYRLGKDERVIFRSLIKGTSAK